MDGEEVVGGMMILGILHLRIRERIILIDNHSRDGDLDSGLELWVELLLGMLPAIEDSGNKNPWYRNEAVDGLEVEAVGAATTMHHQVEVILAQVPQPDTVVQVSDPQVEDSH